MAFRLLVCGGRDFNDRVAFGDEMGHWAQCFGDLEIICGYDPDDERFQGADQLAYEWALHFGFPVFPFPAPWKKRGRSAGPFRNQRMLDLGKPHRVHAFPGGRGTADMCRRADEAGVPVYKTAPNEEE